MTRCCCCCLEIINGKAHLYRFDLSLSYIPENLGLTKNFISGFPSQIFGMINLKVLDLDTNLIEEVSSSGIINPSISSRLEELYLTATTNSLSPPMSCFSSCNIKHLWLTDNKIASPLPSGLGMISKLEELDLESKFSTGPIPS